MAHSWYSDFIIESCNRVKGAQSRKAFSILKLLNFGHVSFSTVAHTVKNLPAIQEIQVQSLGQEDPLEKGMATHSSTLSWRIPWTEEPGGLQSMELHRAGHFLFTFL